MPRSLSASARVLVLNPQGEGADRFWDAVVEVCRALPITPVVLTVARSEREARQRQQFAEETFASHGLRAYFDFVVGCDVRTAVASVARWRRCSHVFVARRKSSSWWRWWHGDTREQLLGLSNRLTVLDLPCGPGPAVAAFEEVGAQGAEPF